MIAQATVFKNNQSQAIRLPKLVALDEHIKQVTVIALGKTRIITPTDHTWDDWFDQNNTTDDFMNERLQEADQVRESL